MSVVELYNEELRDMLVPDSDDQSRGRVIGFDVHTHAAPDPGAHVYSKFCRVERRSFCLERKQKNPSF